MDIQQRTIENRFYSRRKELIVVIAMLLVLFAVWYPVLKNDFLTNWDDQWMVTGNPHLLEVTHLNTISPEVVATVFAEPYNGQYSPFNTLAYMVIIKAGGMEPFGFQLFFLMVHLCNFLLVGLLVQKLLGQMPGIGLKEKTVKVIAWLTAFLFAVHPMQVEAVAWISASKIPLYSFFYLLGLWFYLRYKENGRPGTLLLVLFCFVASLLAKEQAVVFVATLVVVDLAIHTNLKQKKLWLEKIPFVLIALFFGWFTLTLQSTGVGGSYPPGQRLLFANYSFWEYLVKLTAPYGLSYFYFFPMDPGDPVPLRLWFYPMATAFFLWVLVEFRGKLNSVLAIGGLFFLINIAMALHIIPVPREAIIADRYVYLSSIGFFMLLIYLGTLWLVTNKGALRNLILAGCGLYLIIIAGYSHERVKVWENMETLDENIRPLVEMHTDVLNFNLSEPCQ
ncbi:MAG: hypothetical protein JJU13_16865 [Balneolaceae bacterium]|nr:hypothetical protein [Balneolaceae bacterium]